MDDAGQYFVISHPEIRSDFNYPVVSEGFDTLEEGLHALWAKRLEKPGESFGLLYRREITTEMAQKRRAELDAALNEGQG